MRQKCQWRLPWCCCSCPRSASEVCSSKVCAASSEEGGLTNLTRSKVDQQTEQLVTQQRDQNGLRPLYKSSQREGLLDSFSTSVHVYEVISTEVPLSVKRISNLMNRRWLFRQSGALIWVYVSYCVTFFCIQILNTHSLKKKKLQNMNMSVALIIRISLQWSHQH